MKEYRVTRAHKMHVGGGRWVLVRGRIRKYATLEEAKAGLDYYLKGQKERHNKVVSWRIEVREVTPWETVDDFYTEEA